LKPQYDEALSDFAFNFKLRRYIEGLPLDRRIHALFAQGQRTVLRFARIMHFAPAGSTADEVIAALLTVAHLVQGRGSHSSTFQLNVSTLGGLHASTF
jgi:hypothetical protein